MAGVLSSILLRRQGGGGLDLGQLAHGTPRRTSSNQRRTPNTEPQGGLRYWRFRAVSADKNANELVSFLHQSIPRIHALRASHPFMVVSSLSGAHPCQVQPPLVSRLEFWGKQWHRNALGPSRARRPRQFRPPRRPAGKHLRIDFTPYCHGSKATCDGKMLGIEEARLFVDPPELGGSTGLFNHLLGQWHMRMRNIITIIALVLAVVAGWVARGARRSPQTQTQTELDTAQMAKLYPAALALAACQDMRVLVSLSSNNVTMAKSLLLQDLKGHASSLSNLGQQYSLTDFDRKAGRDAEDFLRDFRQ